jgi:hypothetical protein
MADRLFMECIVRVRLQQEDDGSTRSALHISASSNDGGDDPTPYTVLANDQGTVWREAAHFCNRQAQLVEKKREARAEMVAIDLGGIADAVAAIFGEPRKEEVRN